MSNQDKKVLDYPPAHAAPHPDLVQYMKADLCVRIVKNARYGIVQSMNSAGGRCHDNARCESMWARMKDEQIYFCSESEQYTIDELKHIIWVYYMSYWNNRRICSTIGGIPPVVKRKRFFAETAKAVG